MYTNAEKQKIEQVIAVFQDYIHTARNLYGQPSCEIVWLDRMQCYVLLLNYSMTKTINEKDLFAIPIQSAEELYAKLIYELAHEVYAKYNFAELHPEDISDETMQQAQTEIVEHLTPYLQALPEYQELAMQTIIKQGKIYTDRTIMEIVE